MSGENESETVQQTLEADTSSTGRPRIQTGALKAMLEQAQQERLAEEMKPPENAITEPQRFGKDVSPLILDQIRSLPIYSVRDELVELIKANPVVVVKGETGSGKSTQIPKYLVAAGYAPNGKAIAVTQPRRVAAKSLAERVAKETGTDMGDLIGYAVRFDKCSSQETIIKYVTDGLLIKEATGDPDLNQYSVVMIDEAHERSIHTDLCFGLLKRICKSRPDFRVVISSATLEEVKFSKYFDNAPVFNVGGRAFPVDIIYEPKPPGLYLEGVADAVTKICRTESQGDLLVFLAGMDDIDAVWKSLTNRISNGLLGGGGSLTPTLVQCHASLPFAEQQKMFDKTPSGVRKIILATNIAETTLTIEGMDYVVDCGYFKQSRFDPVTKMEALIKQRITKFQAVQRAGRAGRTRPGKCYRLYSEQDMNSFTAAPIPEIERYNVQYVILDIIAMGFQNPLDFEFMTPPPTNTVNEGISYLKELAALDPTTGSITQMGRIMGRFPVEPQLAKVLIKSVAMGCCSEVLKIAAMLCTQHMNIFIRPQSGNTPRADPRVSQFTRGSDGDHLTLLKVYNGWEASGYSEQWCRNNVVEYRYLEEARDIMRQLKEILDSSGLDTGGGSGGANVSNAKKESILRAFTSGYFRQVAKKRDGGFGYKIVSTERGVSNQEVFLHPSSSLFKKNPPPQWIIFHGILKTSKPFLRGDSEIQPRWMAEFAPEFARACGIYN